MKKSTPAGSPDEYVASLSGWWRACVEHLRANVGAAGDLEEAVKWGHLVYSSNGPASAHSCNYEMATLELREGMTASAAIVRKLTKEAIALNRSLGDPRDAAKPKKTSKKPRAKRVRA